MVMAVFLWYTYGTADYFEILLLFFGYYLKLIAHVTSFYVANGF